MNKSQFIEKLAFELGISPRDLTDSAMLSSFPSWDSMGKMAVLAMIDSELSIELAPGSLQKCQTVADILEIVGPKLQA